MVFDVAQADSAIRFRDAAHDIHRRTMLRNAHVHAIGRIAVHAFDFIESAVARQMAALLIGHFAMAAQRKYQRNILRANSGGVQFIQQRGHHAIGGHRAGNIGCNDGDLFAGLHNFG